MALAEHTLRLLLLWRRLPLLGWKCMLLLLLLLLLLRLCSCIRLVCHVAYAASWLVWAPHLQSELSAHAYMQLWNVPYTPTVSWYPCSS
jgi:hypothetical protein